MRLKTHELMDLVRHVEPEAKMVYNSWQYIYFVEACPGGVRLSGGHADPREAAHEAVVNCGFED